MIKGRSGIRRSKSQKIVFAIIFALFVLYSAGLLFPLAFGFNLSLKTNADFYLHPSSISNPPLFSNYLEAFTKIEYKGVGFFMMVLNSIWYALGGTCLELLSTAMCAYVVAKYKFFGRNFVYILSLVVMLIPVYGALPARYNLLYTFQMTDSPLYLLSMANGLGFNFLIMYSFFSMISWEYAESAFIDGANNYTVFFKIMMPLAFPSMTAIGIMGFVGLWNDYETPLIFLRNLPTLSAGVYLFELYSATDTTKHLFIAGSLISLIPALIIYGVFQNTIMQNVYAGGLKN